MQDHPQQRCRALHRHADPKQLLHVMEAFWSAQKAAFADPSSAPQPPAVVRRVPGSCGAASEFDAVVAGGTLGVLLALALQQRGHRVAIVERRVLEGRMQGELTHGVGGAMPGECCCRRWHVASAACMRATLRPAPPSPLARPLQSGTLGTVSCSSWWPAAC